jgi:hypothetical protein
MDILPHGIIARVRIGKDLVDYDWVWVWSVDTIGIDDTRLGAEYISVCFDDVLLADVPIIKKHCLSCDVAFVVYVGCMHSFLSVISTSSNVVSRVRKVNINVKRYSAVRPSTSALHLQ